VLPPTCRSPQNREAPGRVDIQVMAACKERFSALPMLTYPTYAALRFSKNHPFRLALT